MTAIETYTPAAIEEYRPRIVMAPEDAKALDDQLRASMTAVLRKDTDYGIIPGMGDKPTLLKPGAEKLLQWFGFGFVNERDETERDGDGNRIGVTYRCTVTKGLPGGHQVTVATCEGYAGYDEERFFQTAEQAQAKARAKEEFWAARDNRAPNAHKWQHLTGYRAPWNTVIKMAQKRALVGAAIDATAAAGLFTQDLEDMPHPDADGGDGQPSPARGPDNGQQPSAGAAFDESAAPAPQQDVPARQENHPQHGRRWVDDAIPRASAFKTEAAGTELWREAATAGRDGRATRDEVTHVQNIVNARIADRRKEAAARILKPLAEADPWRDKILDGLDGDEEARAAINEVQQLLGAGQLDDDRAALLGRAIIARFPKAALAGDSGG